MESLLASGGGSVQRMKPHRIKLLITLVLFSLVVAGTWATSPADVRDVTKPGAAITSGDPDAGTGAAPPPPPPPEIKLKRLRPSPGAEAGRPACFDWVRWASRIWATLHPRAAN